MPEPDYTEKEVHPLYKAYSNINQDIINFQVALQDPQEYLQNLL